MAFLYHAGIQIFLGSILRSTRKKGYTKYDPSRRRLLRFILNAESSPVPPLLESPVIITLVTVLTALVADLSEVVIRKLN